jgi:hypothetical protein
MKQLYVQGIFNEFAGRRDQAVADLTVYLENSVGVGEHGDLSTEIKAKLEEVSKYDGLLEVMQKYFKPAGGGESEPPAVIAADNLPTQVLDDSDE